MKDTNKPHIYDALILDRALDKKIQEKDLVSNSEVFSIIDEVVNKVRYRPEAARIQRQSSSTFRALAKGGF